MKPKPNQKRRAGSTFNSVDKATGYTLRFDRGKQLTCELVHHIAYKPSKGLILDVLLVDLSIVF